MSKSTINPERQLGELVRDHPEFARVFESAGIDYCCSGDRTLEEACEQTDFDIDHIRKRLLAVTDQETQTQAGYGSPTDLIDHIVAAHHQYLREELPSLEELVRKVRRVHGESHPELHEIEAEFLELSEAMLEHTAEEEDDVFPVIKKLDTGKDLTETEREILWKAIDDLEDDHEEAAAHLERLADLSADYAVPEDACASYESMLNRLEQLEHDTHRHVHKENNVLFPDVEAMLTSS